MRDCPTSAEMTTHHCVCHLAVLSLPCRIYLTNGFTILRICEPGSYSISSQDQPGWIGATSVTYIDPKDSTINLTFSFFAFWQILINKNCCLFANKNVIS
jgi:hypothetical protein